MAFGRHLRRCAPLRYFTVRAARLTGSSVTGLRPPSSVARLDQTSFKLHSKKKCKMHTRPVCKRVYWTNTHAQTMCRVRQPVSICFHPLRLEFMQFSQRLAHSECVHMNRTTPVPTSISRSKTDLISNAEAVCHLLHLMANFHSHAPALSLPSISRRVPGCHSYIH